jgi:hypothetical protein
MTKRFLPNNDGGSGRPIGSRNRLTSKFLYELAQDFEEYGASAIKICRVEQPVRYLQIVASIVPKEFAVTDAKISELGDEEIATLLATVRELKDKAQAEADDDAQSVH